MFGTTGFEFKKCHDPVEFKRGDVIKIKNEYRTCVAADDMVAVFCYSTQYGQKIMRFDVMFLHIKKSHCPHKFIIKGRIDPQNLAYKLNEA